MRVSDVPYLPAVQAQLVAQGTTFTNFTATAPGCGPPARASILRGQYPHSHGVQRGSGDFGALDRCREFGNEDSNIAMWLQNAGYHTALDGKNLNGYGSTPSLTTIPPGATPGCPNTNVSNSGLVAEKNLRQQRFGEISGPVPDAACALCTSHADLPERGVEHGVTVRRAVPPECEGHLGRAIVAVPGDILSPGLRRIPLSVDTLLHCRAVGPNVTKEVVCRLVLGVEFCRAPKFRLHDERGCDVVAGPEGVDQCNDSGFLAICPALATDTALS